MIRRCYCITCGKLHRRSPRTWTGKGCLACGGEVRFTSPPVVRTLRLQVSIMHEELDILGPDPSARLEVMLRDALTDLRRKLRRDAGIVAAPLRVCVDDSAPPVVAKRGRPRRR